MDWKVDKLFLILDYLILNASSGPPSPECCKIFLRTLVWLYVEEDRTWCLMSAANLGTLNIQVRLVSRKTAIPSDGNNLCVLLAASLNTKMLIFLFY